MPNRKGRNYELNLNTIAGLPRERLTLLAELGKTLLQKLSDLGFEFWCSDSRSFGLPLDILFVAGDSDKFPEIAMETLGHNLYRTGPAYTKYGRGKK